MESECGIGGAGDQVTVWTRSGPGYPGELEVHFEDDAPPQVWMQGDHRILERPSMALFCSQRCPGEEAGRTYDVAQHLRDRGLVVYSGFHSPMEEECLRLLVKSPYPVVVGLARRLPGARIPSAWAELVAQSRMLLYSSFPPGKDRTTRASAGRRNLELAALADAVFVAYAEPGSRTEMFCRRVLGWGKPLFVLPTPAAAWLRELGARSVEDLPGRT